MKSTLQSPLLLKLKMSYRRQLRIVRVTKTAQTPYLEFKISKIPTKALLAIIITEGRADMLPKMKTGIVISLVYIRL